jgi:hypothetical protein
MLQASTQPKTFKRLNRIVRLDSSFLIVIQPFVPNEIPFARRCVDRGPAQTPRLMKISLGLQKTALAL